MGVFTFLRTGADWLKDEVASIIMADRNRSLHVYMVVRIY